MRGSIRISPKHGVNPSVGVCFWCGEDDGTVVLLGLIRGNETSDPQAPHRAVYTMDPCDKCKANMALGITIMEASERGKPTGRWCVLKEEAVRRLFTDDVIEGVIEHRKAFMSTEAFNQLFGGVK